MARGSWKTKLLLRIALLILAGCLYLLGQWLYEIRASRSTPTRLPTGSSNFFIQ